MKLRLGRTLRFVIALAFLILMIPFLMSKLESANNQSIPKNVEIDQQEVNMNIFFFKFFIYLFPI
jgi:hypothetical protein